MCVAAKPLSLGLENDVVVGPILTSIKPFITQMKRIMRASEISTFLENKATSGILNHHVSYEATDSS